MPDPSAEKSAMRRRDRTITDPQLLDKMLSKAVTCRLAFTDDQTDCPYILPMTCGYRDGRLVFHAARKGRKIDLINRGGKVAFEIDFQSEILRSELACDWTIHFASIVGSGEITLYEEEPAKKEALRILMEHHGHPGHADFSQRDLAMTAVFGLKIEQMTGKSSDLDWLAELLNN